MFVFYSLHLSITHTIYTLMMVMMMMMVCRQLYFYSLTCIWLQQYRYQTPVSPQGDRGLPGPAGPAGAPGIGLIGSKVMPSLYERKTKTKASIYSFIIFSIRVSIHKNTRQCVFRVHLGEQVHPVHQGYLEREVRGRRYSDDLRKSFSNPFIFKTEGFCFFVFFINLLLSKLTNPLLSGRAGFSRDLWAQRSSRTRSAGG